MFSGRWSTSASTRTPGRDVTQSVRQQPRTAVAARSNRDHFALASLHSVALLRDARRLQLPAFRLTREAIRSARPGAVITTAACALSACSGFRPLVGRRSESCRKRSAPLAPLGCSHSGCVPSCAYAITLRRRVRRARVASVAHRPTQPPPCRPVRLPQSSKARAVVYSRMSFRRAMRRPVIRPN